MNLPVMATYNVQRVLCRIPLVSNQWVQLARLMSFCNNFQTKQKVTFTKQEQTNRHQRNFLFFSDGCHYLAKNIYSTGLDRGVSFTSEFLIETKVNKDRSSEKLLEPIKEGILQEKYHIIRTPRLFHLERRGFREVAVLPPCTSSVDSAAVQSALEMIKNSCQGKVVRKQNLAKCLMTLYHIPGKDLREIIQDDQFSSLVAKMVRICTDLSDDEFESFVVNLATLHFKINLLRVSKMANYCAHFFLNESLRRWERWPLNTLIKICDAFTLMGLKRNALNEKLFKLVEDHIEDLTVCDILQVVYLIGENRTVHPKLTSALEVRILDLMSSKVLSIIEVASVCTAFFKSKSNISSVDFMNALRDFIFATDLSECPSYHIVGILKVFRQNYYGYSTLFETVGNQVSRQMVRYPIQSIMHIVLTFATLHIFHKELMEGAANQIVNKIDHCRSKDVGKLLWSFATLNYTPSQHELVFGVLLRRVEELMDEMEKYPVFLISSLLSLAYMNVYPKHLLEVVFSDRFLSHIKAYETREGIDLRRDLFLLDSCASMECEDNRVTKLNLDYLIGRPFSSHMFWDVNKELEQRSELREVVDSIRELVGGDDYFRVHYVLPYMKTANIEICLDANNQPIAFSDQAESHQQRNQTKKSNSCVILSDSIISKITGVTSKAGKDKQSVQETSEATSSSDEEDPLEDGMTSREYSSDEKIRLKQVQLPQPLLDNQSERSVLVEVSSRNHHHFGDKKLLGLHSMKRRHLAKLGYCVIDIPYYDWELVGRSGPNHWKIYLRNKVFHGSNSLLTKQN